MGHHHHHHIDSSTGKIKTAFFLNLFFTIIEIIGGIMTNSMAILSDALHDLGDSLSLGLAWFLQKFSQKEQSKEFSFGYKRFSLLAALVNSVVLIVGSVFILTEAIPRLLNPEQPNTTGMIILAILGIIVNGAAVFRLRGGDSMNQKVISWHLLEDVLGWAAVLVVSIVMSFTDLPILDPIASIAITVFILYNVIKNFIKTMRLFLEGVPESISLEDIVQKINDVPNINSTHHTHLWSMDGENHAFSTHVVVPEDATKEEICDVKERIKQILHTISLEHVTIEIEYEDESCSIPDSS
ncbi:cation transporter [Halobacillus halophilus]|uniref:Cation efflux system protein, CDF family n=1 Tax=Halobacillus halophilus (strain ATCC 35676 / DSM 2266 / JCM 20832 / KCTC 3685 / LMG 17431 / NBRC 102448 / NCIMB 2269) TaxID=866895 RepID=I0JHT2_HALH3|nr:cation diffusion facilitator family transporter [Halobacillus halophilus]ASF37905.1 cation transporter [Halobacillus halophilus]CCG43700.1 cation efflux system protein, CDF family [Halobacillus halophilus DSM 2266]